MLRRQNREAVLFPISLPRLALIRNEGGRKPGGRIASFLCNFHVISVYTQEVETYWPVQCTSLCAPAVFDKMGSGICKSILRKNTASIRLLGGLRSTADVHALHGSSDSVVSTHDIVSLPSSLKRRRMTKRVFTEYARHSSSPLTPSSIAPSISKASSGCRERASRITRRISAAGKV